METAVFLLVILLIFFLFFIKEIHDNKAADKRLEKELYRQWGERKELHFSPSEMEQIAYFGKEKKEESFVDELTRNDLDMDRVYSRLAYTRSSVGDEYLYYMLRNPISNPRKLAELEEKIASVSQKEPAVGLQKLFIRLGRLKKFSLMQYLEFFLSMESKSNGRHYLADFLLLLSFPVMTLHLGTGLFMLFAMTLFQIVSYFKEKSWLDSSLSSLRYLFSMMHYGKEVLPLLPSAWEQEKGRLEDTLFQLSRLKKNSYLLLSPGRMSGQGLELILDYIRMIFHLDIIKFNRIMGSVKSREEEIRNLYRLLGELDACLAIGEYRNTLSFWTKPGFCDKKEVHVIQGYHPLIEDPVANDLDTKGCILLTGSNASGKSTFLKMLGVNILLACSIHTCMAEKFTIPRCRLFTCLLLRDCLEKGESYYMAEIKAIKRILDYNHGDEAVICMVDEVLRGTNTMERIAASTEILNYMAEKHILVFAATHDRELTYTLEAAYDNYHFEEVINKNDVEFSFLLMPGRADSSNAIRLLEHSGYDPVIVKNARQRLENFRNKGEWM